MRFLVLVALSACATVTSDVGFSGDPPAKGDATPVVLGDSISIGGTCWHHRSVLDLAGLFRGRAEPACEHAPVALSVRCDTACEPVQSGTAVAVKTARLGSLTIHATLRRIDTGEIHEEARTYAVVMPDRLGVQCVDGARFGSCAAGVRAVRPIVRAAAFQGDRDLGQLPLLRINGVPLANGELSLAELFPDRVAKYGTTRGVARGDYTLELAFADMTETVVVRAN